MYVLSSFKDGLDYCLEVHTPFEKQFKVFRTYEAYKEYVSSYLWHLQVTGRKYNVEELEVK